MKLSRAMLLSGIAGLALVSAGNAFAQDVAQATANEEVVDSEDEYIVVTADWVPGETDVPNPPVAVLDEEDIAAYGASSIADLVAQLAPQTNSGRGRGGGFPVFLVNGMRVSSFREMRSYPPESIRRVEILPEEAALRYGYSADQRVINVILKDNFSSTELEREFGQPFDGGTLNGEINATYLRISGPSRLNLNGEFNLTTSLTEAERNIVEPDSLVPTVASDPDPATERTLVDKGRSFGLDGTLTLGLGRGSSLAINGSVARTYSLGRDGFNLAYLTDPSNNTELRVINPDDPLLNESKTLTTSMGLALNHRLGAWDLSATLDGSIADSDTDTDRRLDTSGLVADALAGIFPVDGVIPTLADPGIDQAHSISRNLGSLVTLIGRPLTLPGGEVTTTLRGGYSLSRFESSDTRNLGVVTNLSRDSFDGGLVIGIPVTSRREGFLDAAGDISLNFSAGISDLSDFGSIKDWSAGITWSPTDKLGFQATYLYDEAAPSLSQLGAPTIVNQGVSVYDFTNGQTVFVETISGGNPALTRETRRDVKLSANWELPFVENAGLIVEYFSNHSRDIASAFPSVLTPDIEAAFPDRLVRDGDGNLLSVDIRPVTYAKQDSQRVRFGLNFSTQIGKARQRTEGQEDGNRSGAPGEVGARGGFQGGATPQAGQPVGPPSSGSAPAPGAGGFGRGGFGQGAPGAPGGFDPARFQAMREKFCATPEGETPDLSEMPERLAASMRDENGEIDPAKVAAAKERICSGNGPVFLGGGGQGGAPDPQRFLAIREALCAKPEEAEPDLSQLPEQVQNALKGPDGKIDPERLKQFRDGICAIQLPPQGGANGPQGNAGQQDDGPPQGGGGGGFIFRGPPPGAGGPGGPGGPPGGGPGGGGPPIRFGGGPGGIGGGGDGRGRLFVNLFHTIELKNEVLIAPGLPVLDLLDGDALSGGGTVRHSTQLEGGMFYQGKGMRYSMRYSGPSRIDGTGLPGSSDLRFGSLLTFDVRFFVDLGQQEKLVAKHKFFKGSRLSFSIDNVFDSHRTVTDDSGAVPLRYQEGLIDPRGRAFEIEFRKMF